MSVKSQLQELRTLLTPPHRWTQFEMARDAEGWKTSPCAPDAACWCIYGGIVKVSGGPDQYLVHDQLLTALNNIVYSQLYGYDGAVDLNDNETHERVLALIDKAIEAAP